jgi:hypothetical protein
MHYQPIEVANNMGKYDIDLDKIYQILDDKIELPLYVV